MKTQYAARTEAELRYIIKDAGEAAEAMRGMDSQAEGKYLDQVNDACTELHQRKHGRVKSIERDQIQDGDRVRLVPPYGAPNGEIFTASQCSSEKSRCWIGDRFNFGWYGRANAR